MTDTMGTKVTCFAIELEDGTLITNNELRNAILLAFALTLNEHITPHYKTVDDNNAN